MTSVRHLTCGKAFLIEDSLEPTPMPSLVRSAPPEVLIEVTVEPLWNSTEILRLKRYWV